MQSADQEIFTKAKLELFSLIKQHYRAYTSSDLESTQIKKINEGNAALVFFISNGVKKLIAKKKKSLEPCRYLKRNQKKVEIFLQKTGYSPETRFFFDELYQISEFIEGRTLSDNEVLEEKYFKKIIKEFVIFAELYPKYKETFYMIEDENYSEKFLFENFFDDSDKKYGSLIDFATRFYDQNKNDQLVEVIYSGLIKNKNFENFIKIVLEKLRKLNLINIFSHGDFTPLNVIFNEENGEIKLIDFEFSGFYPIGWDLCCILCDICFEILNEKDEEKIHDFFEEKFEKFKKYFVEYMEHLVTFQLVTQEYKEEILGNEEIWDIFKNLTIFTNFLWIVLFYFNLVNKSVDEDLSGRKRAWDRIKLHNNILLKVVNKGVQYGFEIK